MRLLLIFSTLLMLNVACSTPKEQYQEEQAEAKETYDENLREAEEEYKEEQKEEAIDYVEESDEAQVIKEEKKVQVVE